MKRFLKILKSTALVIVLLIVIAALAVQTATVQNWLVGIVTKQLSKDLGTTVSVKSVDFSLFNRANINGLFIADKNKDTVLYAGNLNINITDWFFFKDKTDLKHIGLEDAIIKLNRTDSVWNYQFIVNHFASTDTSKKKGGMKLSLKEVNFKNISIVKNDAWRGEELTIKFKGLLVQADSLNLNTNKLFIDRVEVNEPYVDIQKFKGNRPANYVFLPTVDVIDPDPLLLVIKDVAIKNGILAINHDYDKPALNFDGSHILLSPLNANFTNLKIHGDTLLAKININAKDRSGFELKQLKANLRWIPGSMEFKKLDILTNKSHITDYYAMRFKNFDDDFAEYETNVEMDARFNNSYINSDDVAFFAPSLKTWKKELNLFGNWLGTVANFKIEKLFAKEKGNGTTIAGTLAMKGLPDIDKTIISFTDGNIKTNHQDLSAIIPSLKNVTTPNLDALGTILFSGNFNGTISKFNTNGILATALGNITTNLSMELPQKKDATYKGEIDINQFQLGKFLNEDKLGIVDFTGKFDGSSFDVARLKTKFEGSFDSLQYNGYTYKKITTNSSFQKKYFNGELKVNDPNFNLNGQVEAEFGKAIPSFNILGDITQCNLQALNFTKDELHLTGLLDVNFAGTNIDNFLGTAKFLNATVSNNNNKLTFDSLTLVSGYLDSVKYLHFAANDFNANVNGDFKILDLSNCFQSFLHNYYPAYIAAPASVAKNQKFAVTLNTSYVEPYLQLFDKNIKGFNDASLTGTIDTKNNLFNVSVLLPYGKYKNYIITDAEINGKGNRDTLNLTGTISNFQVSDSLSFPNSNISIVSNNDLSDISIKTRASNTLNEADLNANIETSPNGIKIKFNPSSFILNEKKWNLDKEGEISFTKNLTEAKNVKFVQGFQEITLETKPDEGGNTSSLDVKLKDVVAGDIAFLFAKDVPIEGIANGFIHVDDVFGKLSAYSDVKIDQFRLGEDSVGLVHIASKYNSKTGILSTSVESLNKDFDFSGSGIFNLKDSNAAPISTILNLRNTKVDLVQKLIGSDVFSNLTGFATGKLAITGTSSALSLAGKVKLRNAGMKVNYTQVYYKIDSADISFDEDGIDFGEFNIKDTLGHIGVVKGKLYEKHFKNMYFDFDLYTNRLLMLNTKAIDNKQFYGNVIGKATLSFRGPEDNCKMMISGEATDESHITLPNGNSRESSEADFIVFKPIGEEIVDAKKQSNFNVLVDLDLMANNKVNIDVVLDEANGDVINARGNGRLKMRVGTTERMDMRGKYNIEEGSYNFNFQSIVRKPFLLSKNDNNYIEWDGDPMNANIHIDAMYEAKNVSLKDLQTQASFSTTTANYRDDVYVIASLTGKLTKPDFRFKFDFPANSPIKNDDTFDRFRRKMESDDNEMLKQVTYLIVFNSFAPYGDASVAQTNFSSIGLNSISALVTKQINKQFTNLLYKITKDKSLQFDLASSVYSSGDLFSQGITATSNTFDRYNVKFKIGKSFFSDKVRLTFGSDFDFNFSPNTQTSAQSGNFQWLPDWNVEWSLNSDKNLLLILFSKNSLDISGNNLGRRNRQGVGITYKKDFNRNPFEKKNNQVQTTKK